MDIFTTQLTKVRQNPIKPEKLRVKSLNKDAAARSLDEEMDHLDEPQRDIDKAQQFEQHYHQSTDEPKEDEKVAEQSVELKGSEQSKAKKTHDDDDTPLTHLDIFV